MKKLFLTGLMLISVAGSCFASSVVLVYPNRESVLNGKPVMGTLVDGGVLVPATDVLSSKDSLFVGTADSDALKAASLIRVDLSLNIAFLASGAPINETALLAAHQRTWAAVKRFLPSPASENEYVPNSEPASPVVKGPFQLKINGQVVTQDPVVLTKRFKKSKFKMEIVNVSSVPVWNIDVKMESDPKLSFWKQGRKTGLNDVPQAKFQYSQQIFFRPLAAGKSILVPMEVFFIERDDYTWTVRISYKDLKMEQLVRVKFKSS